MERPNESTFLQRQLQTAAVTTFVALCFLSVIIGCGIFFFVLNSSFWWLALLYVMWMYFDKETPEMGGRSINWAKNLKFFQYSKDYCPAQLSLDDEFGIEPKRNYLFCCFPHGMLPIGAFNNLVNHASDFHKLYPNFKVLMTTLNFLFYTPLWREYAMAVGFASCSVKSLDNVLRRPEGGNVMILIVGGITETLINEPGKYRFVVANRRGFVKIALKNGTPLVPVISFGEADIFEKANGAKMRRVYEVFRKFFGAAPVFYYGRGWLVPKRKLITTVLGKPIEVIKVENATKEQIEELHQKFVKELVQLFEKHKHKYLEDPNNTYLELL